MQRSLFAALALFVVTSCTTLEEQPAPSATTLDSIPDAQFAAQRLTHALVVESVAPVAPRVERRRCRSSH